jgi:peptide/nickel transport system substrate-binding protein
VWTFKLRQGVTFHDGVEFTAAAVISSFQRTIDKGVLSYVFLPVAEMTIIDDYTVQFVLEYPAPLDYIFSNLYGVMIMSPAALAQDSDWFRENDAGTGPYTISSHDENQRLVLARYDDYWGGWQDDQYTTVVYEFVEDGPTREQMIRSGDADFTFGLPQDTYPILGVDPNVTVDVAPSFQHISIHLNTQKPPLTDVRVRQALAYSFPYADVAQTVWGGYGRPTNSLVPALLWGDEEIPTVAYEHDLNKARALLAEAGVGGFDLYFPYTTSDFESVKQLGELWKAELAKLNINLNIVSLSYDTVYASFYDTDLADEGAHDAFAMLWWPVYASPHEFLAIEFASYALFRTTGYDNPDFDNLVDTALSLSATDREVAWRMFYQAEQQIIDEAVAVPVIEVPGIIAYRNVIQGFEQNANYAYAVFWYDLRHPGPADGP